MSGFSAWLQQHLAQTAPPTAAPADATATPQALPPQGPQNTIGADTQTPVQRYANSVGGSPLSRALQFLPKDALRAGTAARANFNQTAGKGDLLGASIGAGLAAVPFATPGGEAEGEGLNLLGHEVNPAMRAARAVDGVIPGSVMNAAGGAVPITHDLSLAATGPLENMKNAHMVAQGGDATRAQQLIAKAWAQSPKVAEDYIKANPILHPSNLFPQSGGLQTIDYAGDALHPATAPAGPPATPPPAQRVAQLPYEGPDRRGVGTPAPVASPPDLLRHPLDNPAVAEPAKKKSLLESFFR